MNAKTKIIEIDGAEYKVDLAAGTIKPYMVTYSIGDFFKNKDGYLYILAGVDRNKTCLIKIVRPDFLNLGGVRWNDPVVTQSFGSVTQKEFDKITGGRSSEFTKIGIKELREYFS